MDSLRHMNNVVCTEGQLCVGNLGKLCVYISGHPPILRCRLSAKKIILEILSGEIKLNTFQTFSTLAKLTFPCYVCRSFCSDLSRSNEQFNLIINSEIVCGTPFSGYLIGGPKNAFNLSIGSHLILVEQNEYFFKI